ncbi:MAG: transcriptional repressor [Brevinematales bacterium]
MQDIRGYFPDVHKTSIYRALEYLQKEGLVESFVLPCSKNGTQTYYLSTRHHSHFFHCEECHRFFPLQKCPLPEKVFSQPYIVSQHVFYLVGICPDCFGHNNQNLADDKEKDHSEE